VTRPAAQRWAELQSGRGIPPEILAAAPANPWTHEVADFTAPAVPADTPSRAAALALLEAGGTVLDVGCGGGDAAFAVAERTTYVTGVDQQPDMLAAFAADATGRGLAHRTVLGRWPEVAAEVGRSDVVLSHHVLHNVVDLPPFVAALAGAARRGVVIEMLAQHPMAWLDPLWVRFHDLHRPPPATTDDAVAVLHELGIEPTVVRWERQASLPRDSAWVTRRLCLSPDRLPEVEDALAGLPPRSRAAATLTWKT
jgi:2-polyprenyl-3-methyl-5-hydroxy-6-metoxy-1,4-benzoquinol methylase